ncbi:gliding motility-associated C-terminal domain-containing protein [Chitinophaga eiseniae]|uniref:DUF11 domain-containing protein n=1 Tax=Chitinophaga eiseniae TaxID=634771 RepID=A0A847SE14_9BACT|nr:gliding motility-associated C-terminal domain-containing protein [Chitinophaga eiseniae]NLR78424.1 DUF11 domain-containing protein [Chitinophaga eiseniae]
MGIPFLSITPTDKRNHFRNCRTPLLIAFLCLVFLVRVHAQFTITENFKNNTAGNVTLGGTAKLTSGTIDPAGNGWLRLTEDQPGQVGYAYVNQSFPSTLGVVADFEYLSWRSVNNAGADGFSMFLFSDTVTAFRIGAPGGSLGYANSNGTPGLNGGYVGIGVDEYGNYGNCGFGKSGGQTTNCGTLFKDYISARGQAPTYTYLSGAYAGTSLDYDVVTASRPTQTQYYRRIQMTILPNGLGQYTLTVKWKTSPTGNFSTLFGPYTMPTPPPARLKLGFAASTGGSYNKHEIRNLIITTPGNIRVQKQVDKSISIPGDTLTYQVTTYNETASALSNLPIIDNFNPANGFNVTSVAFSNGGFSGNTASGYTNSSFSNVTANMVANSSITFTVKGTVQGKPPGLGNLINTVYVDPAATGISDNDPSNDTSRATTQIIIPDLAITKTHNGNIRKGASGNYVLTVTNVGADVKMGPSTVTVRDVVPAGLVAGTPTGTGWDFTGTSGNSIVATRTTSLAGGASYPVITIPVTVQSTAPDRIINTTTVANEYETILSNNTASDTVDTRRKIDWELVSLVVPPSRQACANTPFQVQVNVRNNGPDMAVNGRFNFNLQNAANTISLVSRTITSGTGSFGAGSSTSANGYVDSVNLSSGGTARYLFSINASPAVAASLTASLLRAATDLDTDASDTAVAFPSDPQHECDGAPSGASCNNIKSDTIVITDPPTPSNAGNDQRWCNLASVTLNGNAPSSGTGYWTQFDGPNTATVTNAAQANSTATGLLPGTYHFVWTISNGACSNSSDTMAVVIDAPPTTANAGRDQQLCNATSATMAANTAVSGAGSWSQVSGPNNAVFADATNAGTSISGLVPGTYTFVWSIGNGVCPSSTDTMLIINSPAPSSANAGPDQVLCNVTVTTMTGNAPTAGTGNWTTIAGPAGATFTDPASPSTNVTGLQAGVYHFGWTISSGNCAASSDTVQVTVNALPTVANAGPDQLQNNSGLFTMNANAPLSGTGAWVVKSGNASITDVTNPNTTTTLQPNTSAVLTWTISSGNCPASVDTVMLNYVRLADLKVTKSDAGNTYRTGTGLTYTITIENLGPSDVFGATVQDVLPPQLANPTWTSVVTGAGVGIDPASGNGNAINASFDMPAAAGNKIVLTVTGAVADTAVGGSVIRNEVEVSAPSDVPDPNLNNNISSVTGIVPNNPPVAADDQYITKRDVPVSGNVLANDHDPENQPLTVSATLPVSPANGSVVQHADGTFTYTPNPGFVGTDTYSYNVCDNQGSCTAATVTITVQPGEADLSVTKVANPVNAVAGQNLAYTITVTNNGPSTIQAGETFIVGDNLPQGFTAQSYSVSAGTYTSGSGQWTGATLVPGQQATLTIAGQVAPGFTGGSLANTVTVNPPSGVTDTAPNNNTSTIVTPVSRAVEVVVTKTDNSSSYTPGTPVAYAITYVNHGPSDVQGLRVTDVLPAGITSATWTYTAASGGQSGDGTGAIDTTIDLPAGPGVTFLLTMNVPSSFTGQLVNTAIATVPSGYTNINPGANAATDTDTLELSIDPHIEKDGPASVIAGDSIIYHLKVYNNGPSDMAGAIIGDVLPSVIQNPTWTITTAGNASAGVPGGSGNINFSANLPAGSGNVVNVTIKGAVDKAAGGQFNNTATVTPSGQQAVSSNNVNTVVQNKTGITVVKESTPAGNVTAGNTIQYKIHVTNAGPSDATGVTITDQVPASVLNPTWTVSATGAAVISGVTSGSGSDISTTADIPAGAANEIVVTVNGTIAPAATGTIVNTATATPSGGSAVSANNSVQVTDQPGLQVLKTGPASADAGTNISYTVTVTNSGPSDVPNVSITDIVPSAIINANWTATTSGSATIANGASGIGNNVQLAASIPAGTGNSIVVTVTGTLKADASGIITNSASAQAGAHAPVTSNSVTTTVNNNPRMVVDKSGPATASAGSRIDYLINVSNDGPSDAFNAQLVDTVPGMLHDTSVTVTTYGNATVTSAIITNGILKVTGNFPAGSNNHAVILLSGTIDPAFKGMITNQAFVDTGNHPQVASAQVLTTVTSDPKLVLTKSGPNTIAAGQQISYQLVLTNIGLSDASNITIQDNVSNQLNNVNWTASAGGQANIMQGGAGTGNAVFITGNVPAGSGNSITVTITGIVAPGASGMLRNFGTVSGPDAPQLNSDTVNTVVNNQPGLQITKGGPVQSVAGARIQYTLDITNVGPSDAQAVNISDQLPTALRDINWTATASGGAVISGGATGTSSNLAIIADIPAGNGRITVTIDARVNPAASGTINNTATATTGAGMPVSSSVQTLITSEPVLSISKSGPPTAHAGEQVIYTVVAANTGVSDANNVTIQDIVPAQLTSVSWNAVTGNNATITSGATGSSNNVLVNGNLPAGVGNHISITVTGTIPPGFTGTLNNVASGFMPAKDTVKSDTIVTNVTTQSILQVVKGGFDSTAAGGPAHYEITITNNGPSDAVGVSIADVVDSHINNVTWHATAIGNAQVANGSGSGNSISMTANIPAGSGNSVILQIDGTVDPAYTGDIKNVATATAPGQSSVTSDTFVTHVTNIPSVKMTKSGPAEVAAGDQISWTLTVSNNGPSNAPGITIKDTVPAGVSNISWTTVANGASQVTTGGSGTGNIVNVGADVIPGVGNTVTITVTGTLDAGYTGARLFNRAVVEVPGRPTITDTISTRVIQKPGIQIVKTGPGTISAGEPVTYTITVTNSGPSDAVNVAIADTLATALQHVQWTVATTGAGTTAGTTGGNSQNINISGNIPAGNGNKIVITVNAMLDADYTGASLDNKAIATPPGWPAVSSVVTTTVTRNVDLHIVKSGPANAVAGDAVTYTITVTNEGPANAKAIQITDILPSAIVNAQWTATGNNATVSSGSGTGSVNITADIPATGNASVVIVINGKIDGAAAAGLISNTASATPASGETDISPATSTVNTNITRSADLSIVKSGPTSRVAGQAITWQLDVTNNGISDVKGALIRDAIPTNVTINSVNVASQGVAVAGTPVISGNNIAVSADIAAGSGNSVTVLVAGTIASAATGTLSNTATVSTPADVTESIPANNSSTVNTTIITDVGLHLSKSGPATVNVGDTIHYTLLLSNNGSSDATNIAIADNVPADITNVTWTAATTGNASTSASSSSGNTISLTGTLGGNLSGEIQIDIRGVVNQHAGNTVVNTATATFNGIKTATVTTSVNKSANLRLTKTGPATLAAGQPITYVVKVTNAGPADVTNVTISDMVPSGIDNITWTASASGGASVTPGSGTNSNISLQATMPASTDTITLIVHGIVTAGFTGNLVNTATATPPSGVTNPVPATATVTTIVTSEPGLVIVKSGPAEVLSGNAVTYHINVRNNGPSDAPNVYIKDTVPAQLTNVSWTVTGNGTPISGTGNIINVTANLRADSAISVFVTGVTNPAFSGAISNRAVTGDGITEVSSNTINTNVINQPALQVSKSGPAQIAAGQPISYVISIANAGPSTANGATITDVIPTGISHVTWTAKADGAAAINGGDITNGDGNVSFTANIPAGGGNSILVTVKGLVDPDASGSLTNVVSVTPNGGAPVTATAVSNIVNQPGIRIQKSGTDSAVAGNMITYTVNVYNDGPSNASSVSIADAIPAQLQQAVWSATAIGGATINGGNVSNQTGNVSLTANIPAGAANLIQIQIYGTISPAFSGSISNTATGMVNGQAISSNTVTTKVTNKPGVQLLKSGPGIALAGGDITYTLVLSNVGPSNAANIAVNDILPVQIQHPVWSATAAGAASISGGDISNHNGNVVFTADVPAGVNNKVLVTITGHIPSSLSGTLTNVAGYTIGGSSGGTTPPVNTVVKVNPGLSLRKSGPDTVIAGSHIVYTLLAANNGPADAANMNIFDVIPASIANVSWTTVATGATINSGSSGSGNNLNVTGSITAGGSITVTINGTIAPDATGNVMNNASLSYNGTVVTRDSVNTRIINTPGVSVSKSGPPQVNAGNTVSYEIDVTNEGPSDLQNATIRDLVPAMIRNVTWNITAHGSATLAAGTPISGSGNAISFLGNIPAGSNNHIVVAVTGMADPDSTGTITNTAKVKDVNGNEYTGSVATQVTKAWQLSIGKTGPAAVNAGEHISYIVTATNLGPSNAKGITVTDMVPSTVTNVTWTAVANGYATVTSATTGAGNNILVTGDIAAGAGNNIYLIINGEIPANTPAGTISNVATLERPDGTTIHSTPVSTVITRSVKLSIVKQAAATAYAGDSLKYTITVNNAGPSDTSNVAIGDIVPAALTGVSWNATAAGAAQIVGASVGTGNNVSLHANLPAGVANTVTLTISGRIDPDFAGAITNQATAGNTASNITTTNVTAAYDLKLTKTGPAVVTAGDTVSYVLTVTNGGPSNAKGVRITDAVPATLTGVTWTTRTNGIATAGSGASGSGNNVAVTGDINAGSGNSIQVLIRGIVPANTPAGTITNIGALTSPDNTTINSTPVLTAITRSAKISIVKQTAATAHAGDSLKYTITVNNAGPSDTSNVAIGDVVPAALTGVSWNAAAAGAAQIVGASGGTGNNVGLHANLPAGTANTVTLTISGRIDPDFAGAITNQATAGNIASNITTTNVTSTYDLQLTKTGPSVVNAGDTVSYVLTVTNGGPSNAKGVRITDAVPATLTSVTWTTRTNGAASAGSGISGSGNNVAVTGDINAGIGNSIQVLIRGVVPANTPAGTLTNIGALTSPDNTTINSTPVLTAITRSAKISIVKQAPATANAGNNIRFVLIVTNTGPSDADNISISDIVPASVTAVNWTTLMAGTAQVTANATGSGNNVNLLGTIPAGAGNSITVQIDGRIAADYSGTISNTANVVNGPQTISSNTTSTSIIFVPTPVANLSITKSGPAQIGSGEHISYTIIAQNNGPASADGAVITDILPASLQNAGGTIVATGGATGIIGISGNVARITAANFPAGATIRIVISGKVNGDGTLRNSANITPPAGVTDPDMSNNTSALVVTTVEGADVEVVKTLLTNEPLMVGSKADFSIAVKNNGPSVSKGITVRDTLRSNMELIGNINSSVGTISYDPVGRILVWNIDSLRLMEAATLSLSARIVNTGTVVNLAALTAETPDPNSGNNISVTTEKPVTGTDIFIPNVITPNGDGRNEKFQIIGISRYPNSSLFIYNRWGNEVYQSKNYQNTWDGQGLNEGTYFYLLRLNTPNGERAYKGWIELLR